MRSPGPWPTYDDREVALILARAAELHELGAGRHVTRGELEEIAAELGISKALVRRAENELAVRGDGGTPSRWLGGKTELCFQHTVAGSIDRDTVDALIEVMRQALAEPGEFERQGNAWLWTARSETRRVFLSIVARGEHTEVTLTESMPGDARLTAGSPG